MDIFKRTRALLGNENLNVLKDSIVVVFGLGGVGGHAAETLVRSGIGTIIIVDDDTINETNINRQIIATVDEIDKEKTLVMKERIEKINPDCNVISYNKHIYEIESLDFLDNYKISYIVDAIDTFEGKISIIKYANKNNIPLVSSMGTGNKLDPKQIEVTDVFKTSMCPLAKKIRNRLRKENINSLKVIYSKEPPIKHEESFIGSVSFVPSVAGIIAASEVIRDLCGVK